MNKNSYYYKKLGQSFLFSTDSYKDICDEKDPHDNIFSREFLDAFESLLIEYQKKEWISKEKQSKIFCILDDIRRNIPYQTRTEKEEIVGQINSLIGITHLATDEQIDIFYWNEWKKRYGVYLLPVIKQLTAFVTFLVDSNLDFKIETEVAQDIYFLTLLHYEPSELEDSHIKILTLNDFLFSTMNAMMVENPGLLKDSTIRSRFLFLLRKNRELLLDKNCRVKQEDDNGFATKVQNAILLKKLERMEHKKMVKH